MIRGIYTSGWSMMANSKRMDVISNNLANVNTNAYKKDNMITESFPDVLTKRINDSMTGSNPSGRVGNMSLGSDVGEVFTNYSQGQIVKTDTTLDMAITDSDGGFFSVSVPDKDGKSKELYTRDGAFALDSNGQLITKEGYSVLGSKGPITLNGDDFSIEADGSIVQDGKLVDKLSLKEFEDTRYLKKYGSNLVEKLPDAKEQPFAGNIKQGYTEQSNVNSVSEMVEMISVLRSYEANQKILQYQDSTLEKAVTEVGVLR